MNKGMGLVFRVFSYEVTRVKGCLTVVLEIRN
jgi:hypothetical protein